jgi:hypothetical protein
MGRIDWRDEGNTVQGNHTKIASTERYLGLDVDDARELAEQTEVQMGRWPVTVPMHALTGHLRSIDVTTQLSDNQTLDSHNRCAATS